MQDRRSLFYIAADGVNGALILVSIVEDAVSSLWLQVQEPGWNDTLAGLGSSETLSPRLRLAERGRGAALACEAA